MSIAQNLRTVEAQIQAAAIAAGRDPGTIRLLPVSKTMPTAAIREAHAAGYQRFGENKVQEAQTTAEELAGTGIELAVIGHLQTNKAKYVARFAHEFQALDNLDLARELDKRLHAQGRQLDVLVQVNSSAEPQKFGADPDQVLALTKELQAFDSLKVRGLMTLALFTSDEDRIVACFDRMKQVQLALRDRDGGGWDELSMGMSGDFELAIAHGSTCVRVGQAIFGSRLNANTYWPGAAPEHDAEHR
ncbi:MAG: YggS family pyridoxal phosphate-dependent enzyme [Propionibacteriaceae bacterium]